MVVPGGRAATRAVTAFLTAPPCPLPATRTHAPLLLSRRLSTTPARESRIGRKPISVPPGVDISIGEPVVKADPTTYLRIPKRTITVQGPLGNLYHEIPPFITISQDGQERTAMVSIEDVKIREQREMWGTTRAYLQNHVKGVSEGHTAILRLVGVGYRASLEKQHANDQEYPGQPLLVLKLGYTNPIESKVPEGIKVTVASPTRVLMEATDRVLVMSFAARLRKWRPPEPYKGKGIFINDQTIKLKGKNK